MDSKQQRLENVMHKVFKRTKAGAQYNRDDPKHTVCEYVFEAVLVRFGLQKVVMIVHKRYLQSIS